LDELEAQIYHFKEQIDALDAMDDGTEKTDALRKMLEQHKQWHTQFVHLMRQLIQARALQSAMREELGEALAQYTQSPDSPLHKRTVIRVLFALIESFIFANKQIALAI